MNNCGISRWDDPNEINARLKALTSQPIWEVTDDYYNNVILKYFDEKCKASKAVYEESKEYIPGGVQHNLAFNKPFPMCMARADGAYLYDKDGNQYIDFLQAGGPTILGSNYPVIREKVIELLNECGPVTGLLHESELMIAKEINKHMPNVEMFRMLGSGTESVMAALRIARIATGKKRIIIATFASNLYRVQQLIDLAVKAGRKVAVSGRSMVNNTQMALELGYLHAPETVLIDIEDINKYPPEKIVLITTGSQGEPLSALSRMAAASHRNVRVGEGDFIIISANPIPGNEKMVTKVVNGLLKLGAEVIYESMYDVHVSGHACQEEQKLMLTLAKPQFFLPVHGEYKHLKKHAQTAAAVGIPEKNIYIGENGDCVVLSADGLTVGEPVPAGAVMVDGLGVGDVGNVVLRDRRHLSEDGLVIVVATIDARTGEVLAGPDLVSRGFVYVRESEKLLDDARDQVRDVLGRMSAADKRDFGSVKTRIRETVSAFLYRKTKRSPMILPILMEV